LFSVLGKAVNNLSNPCPVDFRIPEKEPELKYLSAITKRRISVIFDPKIIG